MPKLAKLCVALLAVAALPAAGAQAAETQPAPCQAKRRFTRMVPPAVISSMGLGCGGSIQTTLAPARVGRSKRQALTGRQRRFQTRGTLATTA